MLLSVEPRACSFVFKMPLHALEPKDESEEAANDLSRLLRSLPLSTSISSRRKAASDHGNNDQKAPREGSPLPIRHKRSLQTRLPSGSIIPHAGRRTHSERRGHDDNARFNLHSRLAKTNERVRDESKDRDVLDTQLTESTTQKSTSIPHQKPASSCEASHRTSPNTGAKNQDQLPVPQDTPKNSDHGPQGINSSPERENVSISGSSRDGVNSFEHQREVQARWILNLSMTFRDDLDREKFFVTYAERPNQWRRVTVTCSYRHKQEDSLEAYLKSLHFQQDKSSYIYCEIRDSLPTIQYYDTVTNLELETVGKRLHIHVAEDMNEIIAYPLRAAIRHLNCALIPESALHFEAHLSGFVYKVGINGRTYVKKEIPAPDMIEEFLYEVHALQALSKARDVINFHGVVVDELATRVKGLLISYAEGGALVDLIYDRRDKHLPWPRREKWAKQIVQGLSDIHECGFVQGDFTLSNIVIDRNDDAKLIDINRRGCPVGWEPPEFRHVLDSGQKISMRIGNKSDLYQLGMVLWGLAALNEAPEFENQLDALHEIAPDCPSYLSRLASICLSDAPEERKSAKELLSIFPDQTDLSQSREARIGRGILAMAPSDNASVKKNEPQPASPEFARTEAEAEPKPPGPVSHQDSGFEDLLDKEFNLDDIHSSASLPDPSGPSDFDQGRAHDFLAGMGMGAFSRG